jgi:predicted  nucleic acid-binding Zn-ribbon protein
MQPISSPSGPAASYPVTPAAASRTGHVAGPTDATLNAVKSVADDLMEKGATLAKLQRAIDAAKQALPTASQAAATARLAPKKARASLKKQSDALAAELQTLRGEQASAQRQIAGCLEQLGELEQQLQQKAKGIDQQQKKELALLTGPNAPSASADPQGKKKLSASKPAISDAQIAAKEAALKDAIAQVRTALLTQHFAHRDWGKQVDPNFPTAKALKRNKVAQLDDYLGSQVVVTEKSYDEKKPELTARNKAATTGLTDAVSRALLGGFLGSVVLFYILYDAMQIKPDDSYDEIEARLTRALNITSGGGVAVVAIAILSLVKPVAEKLSAAHALRRLDPNDKGQRTLAMAAGDTTDNADQTYKFAVAMAQAAGAPMDDLLRSMTYQVSELIARNDITARRADSAPGPFDATPLDAAQVKEDVNRFVNAIRAKHDQAQHPPRGRAVSNEERTLQERLLRFVEANRTTLADGAGKLICTIAQDVVNAIATSGLVKQRLAELESAVEAQVATEYEHPAQRRAVDPRAGWDDLSWSEHFRERATGLQNTRRRLQAAHAEKQAQYGELREQYLKACGRYTELGDQIALKEDELDRVKAQPVPATMQASPANPQEVTRADELQREITERQQEIDRLSAAESAVRRELATMFDRSRVAGAAGGGGVSELDENTRKVLREQVPLLVTAFGFNRARDKHLLITDDDMRMHEQGSGYASRYLSAGHFLLALVDAHNAYRNRHSGRSDDAGQDLYCDSGQPMARGTSRNIAGSLVTTSGVYAMDEKTGLIKHIHPYVPSGIDEYDARRKTR